MSGRNDVTGDSLVSKISSGEAKKNYDEAWERCFGKHKEKVIEDSIIGYRNSTKPSTCLGTVATERRD